MAIIFIKYAIVVLLRAGLPLLLQDLVTVVVTEDAVHLHGLARDIE